MPNRNNLFYDAVNTVAHSHINCACNNAYRNIYPQFCGTSRRRPLLSLFFPPLQICYDTTHTFFVGAIIGRPLMRILLTTPQSFHDSSPQVAPFMPLLEERWHAVTEWWQTISRHTSYVLLTYPL